MTPEEFTEWGYAVIVWAFAIGLVGVLVIAVHGFWSNNK